jgi:hypothetical protein
MDRPEELLSGLAKIAAFREMFFGCTVIVW